MLIDDEHNALSLATMDTISSAEMQDYIASRGNIQRVHLEALLTRFITFPDAAITLVPLGGLPRRAANLALLERTCGRLDIFPHRAHDRYFTANSTPSKAMGNKSTQTSN